MSTFEILVQGNTYSKMRVLGGEEGKRMNTVKQIRRAYALDKIK